MKRPKFSITHKDQPIAELVRTTDHKTLAVWAIDCVERVLPYFEEKYPEDHRPRNAIETLRMWINTGVFKMAVIRKASLDAHAAAREVGEDNASRSAARAAGQAVAATHVPTHSIGAANYALQAIYRVTNSSEADAAIAKERDWQYQHLLELQKLKTLPKKARRAVLLHKMTTTDTEWFFYIVRCKDNSLYSGITNNLEERAKKHNEGTGAKYTASHRPVTLVHTERYDNASKAKKREQEVKRWPKSKKEELISNLPQP